MTEIADTPEDTAPQAVPKGPATLLFVDDEASILTSLRRLFRPQGYRILLANSGAEGLEVLEREEVDLVISDMRMPEMDGAQFLSAVRERWPRVVRLLLTGYADMDSTIAAINDGGIQRYIAKPWNDNDIGLIVSDAIERARLEDENARLLELTAQQNEELQQLNGALEERVAERTAELEAANEKLRHNFLTSIKVFSGLMDLRGGSVGGHARRVADLARRMAVHLELEAELQRDIFIAALLHDIGKIGFSDAMLAKPVSQLANEDLVRYRKHALVGEGALMPLDDLRAVAALIRTHHERYDGQGFPDGLRGEVIPLGARILAVANDYDGLVSGTLGERKLSEGEAKSLIVQNRGKRYDPKVVDVFTELVGRPPVDAGAERRVVVDALEPGMVLAKDLVARDGTLLLATDFVLDAVVIRQMRDFAEREDLMLVLDVRADRAIRKRNKA